LDSSGQDRFRTITYSYSYYRGVNGIFLVFDLTKIDSFNNIRQWELELNRNAFENVEKVLVGNKCDLVNERKLSYDEGKELADELGMMYFETSAKSSVNVDNMYEFLAMKIYEEKQKRLEII